MTEHGGLESKMAVRGFPQSVSRPWPSLPINGITQAPLPKHIRSTGKSVKEWHIDVELAAELNTQRHDRNNARLARRSHEALEVSVRVVRIAPSHLDLVKNVPAGRGGGGILPTLKCGRGSVSMRCTDDLLTSVRNDLRPEMQRLFTKECLQSDEATRGRLGEQRESTLIDSYSHRVPIADRRVSLAPSRRDECFNYRRRVVFIDAPYRTTHPERPLRPSHTPASTAPDDADPLTYAISSPMNGGKTPGLRQLDGGKMLGQRRIKRRLSGCRQEKKRVWGTSITAKAGRGFQECCFFGIPYDAKDSKEIKDLNDIDALLSGTGMKGRGTGDHLENPSTNGIVRHDSHMRKSEVKLHSTCIYFQTTWQSKPTLPSSPPLPKRPEDHLHHCPPTAPTHKHLPRCIGEDVSGLFPRLSPFEFKGWIFEFVPNGYSIFHERAHYFNIIKTSLPLPACRGRGVVVVILLASHLRRTGFDPRRSRYTDFRMWEITPDDDAPVRRVFSGISPPSPL
ncbi:hypothetical protein PR048_009776 [Dryococelus australis]|uniref:Uncharacterized protein n=1 Tax=Dryococelus australis TaxID=614101 RepID=A0ABQ9I0W4_9NEOP|nr:hypothetical protein PR048_009776 [Dryococelus australis]